MGNGGGNHHATDFDGGCVVLHGDALRLATPLLSEFDATATAIISSLLLHRFLPFRRYIFPGVLALVLGTLGSNWCVDGRCDRPHHDLEDDWGRLALAEPSQQPLCLLTLALSAMMAFEALRYSLSFERLRSSASLASSQRLRSFVSRDAGK
jgi:hypothetical protein